MTSWRETSHPARLEEILPGGAVKCHLSPRNCVIKEGRQGFCGVRANRGGRLVSLNYGKAVHATEETIETEAVNHYSPGERILSLGNIGCMLNCAYCHNWKTSQARYVSDRDVHSYTPESVIEIAKRHGIRCLSWTYNDPVVWHEFILDTARLAKQEGMINLYKSAFFITPAAVEELLPVIDIFSISVKSMDPEYYKRFTTGWLDPVLAATRQVFQAGKHVEVSTLMVTDISDHEETARRVSDWHLREMDGRVPLHFVRFHPDYKMRNTIRTPIPRLIRAREIALEMGVEHVYLGNVYDSPWTTTSCKGCSKTLVTRYGLNARRVHLDDRGHCAGCGRDAHFKLMGSERPRATVERVPEDLELRTFDWHGDIRSLHLQAFNSGGQPARVFHRRRHRDGVRTSWNVLELQPQESYRFILAKASVDELGPELAIPAMVKTNLHEVFDRAHFPTVAVETSDSQEDLTPLPLYPGKQLLGQRGDRNEMFSSPLSPP